MHKINHANKAIGCQYNALWLSGWPNDLAAQIWWRESEIKAEG